MDPDLPDYSARSSNNTNQTDSRHSSSLQDSKGLKWLTLTVKSRAPTSASLPIFYEGDVISGQVDFEVLKSESIKGISIKVSAGITLVGQEEQLFLDAETDLWTPAMTLHNGLNIPKLVPGKYSWPFSLTLPTEVEMQDQKTMKKFALPISFSERAGTVFLDYKLVVTVKRGFLKVNHTLVTAFAYVPVMRPELPSPMLQNAYNQNLPLVGPEGDQDGWHAVPPLVIQGKLFDSHIAEATLNLALARPLTYSRGTTIPLWLTLTGDNEQCLDLLSNPKIIKLFLVRSLATGSDATSDTEHRSDNCFFENVARAVFWPSENYRGQGRRILHGEVNARKTLKPSTLFPRFTISYHLSLQPLEVAGFVVTSTTPKTTSLLRQKITIVNFPALGVQVRSDAPPEYVQEQGADYNKSVGLLENGNQRFYHHGGVGLG